MDEKAPPAAAKPAPPARSKKGRDSKLPEDGSVANPFDSLDFDPPLVERFQLKKVRLQTVAFKNLVQVFFCLSLTLLLVSVIFLLVFTAHTRPPKKQKTRAPRASERT